MLRFIVAIAAGTTVSTAAGCGERGDSIRMHAPGQPVVATPGAVVVVATRIPPPFEIPSLTDAEQEAAVEIVMADPEVQRLLNGRVPSPKAVGVWHLGPLKLGAVVLIAVEPFSAVNDWPSVRYAAYERRGEHERPSLSGTRRAIRCRRRSNTPSTAAASGTGR